MKRCTENSSPNRIKQLHKLTVLSRLPLEKGRGLGEEFERRASDLRESTLTSPSCEGRGERFYALSGQAFRLPNPPSCGSVGGFFFPRETMAYAIIRTGGRQFRVAEGDTLDVDLLDVEPGKTTTFGDVLLFADGKDVTHGNPLISEAKVTAEVVEQRKDNKIVAFKYKRRKGYHRTVGHRRKLTRVKIKTIDVGSKKTGSKKSE
jgi:large subunit ribosomal protein L21